MDYDRIFKAAIDRLHEEGRYRVFIDILRTKGQFPNAQCFAGHNGPKPITVWCSNDYLGMMNSSTRLGAFKVCKTRSEWARWDKCHSATRYCAPIKTAALKDNEDLVCKYLKVTGSRIAQEKVCAARRQWDLMEQETQDTIRARQNQSKIIPGGSNL